MPEYNDTSRLQIAHARQLRSKASDAEILLWGSLRRRQLGGFRFRRQYPIGPYIADFACIAELLVVEVDGGQHQVRFKQDKQRDLELHRRGYRTLRFWNHEVLEDLDHVLERIRAALPERAPPSAPSGHLPRRGRS